MKLIIRKSMLWSGKMVSSSPENQESTLISKNDSDRKKGAKKIALRGKKGKKKDRIPGGLADKKKPSDFDAAALKEGIKVEMEHTSDRDIAREIAMDHLTEDPKYYRKLKMVEKSELIQKAIQYAYQGPMTVADITLASWNEYFKEGGQLNQPSWLQTDRLKKLRSGFERLARYHGPIK